MRHSIIFILLIFTSSCRLLTRKVNIEGMYIESPKLKIFEGTWRNFTANDTFLLELNFTKYFFEKDKMHMDMLVGEYSLTSIGESIDNPPEGLDHSVSLGSFVNIKKQKGPVKFLFHDFINRKTGYATLELIKGNDSTAQWILKNDTHLVVNNEKWDWGFSVPTNMILYKID